MTGCPTAAPGRPFGRVLTAMVSPFDADGALDLDVAQELATHLVDLGNDGLIVNGTTGESPTTTDAEKADLVRAVVAAVGDRATVVAAAGTYDTAHSVHLAKACEAEGAHGLLVVTPYYSRPPQAGLEAHFTAVADATSLPVVLYDIPPRSVVPIEWATLRRLADHPNIVAVKDAKGDLAAIVEVLAKTDLAFYSGSDENNLALLAMGAAGIVSVVGHVAGREYAEMVRAIDAGDLPTARSIERRLLPAFRGIMGPRSQGAIMAKAALELIGVLPGRTTRLPLLPAGDEQVAELRTQLAESGLMR